ncbi:class I SAM-dependent methyltransferase [Eilatimonas milleporae]|uniref:Putative methyltransferase n=1 Tax=Eilatimonas milleporae TaxID=911205 RepID=A0A3M0BVW8_9PROT|nr:class I SAM-dependent methyltransferase [Eilatimonas milleporae]RMB00557.1 putative methyltransferase [Eilatimonas milleporae]
MVLSRSGLLSSKSYGRFFALVLIGSLLALSVASVPRGVSAEEGDAVWRAVHRNTFREPEDAARDSHRHPEDVLRFFGIDETMTVVEVNPGGGWYSRILAPLLKDSGLYVGLEHHPNLYEGYTYADRLRAYPETIDSNRALYGSRAVAGWIGNAGDTPQPAESVDVVLVVRAMHNWVRRGFFDHAIGQSWDMLKPDGVLAVVQHRADPDAHGDRHATTRRGRWKQAELIAAVEAYGFRLEAASDINANPKDAKNYSQGVWTLPPVLAAGDENRAAMRAIGESDRMTLKFVKVVP